MRRQYSFRQTTDDSSKFFNTLYHTSALSGAKSHLRIKETDNYGTWLTENLKTQRLKPNRDQAKANDLLVSKICKAQSSIP